MYYPIWSGLGSHGWVDAIYYPPEYGPLLGLRTDDGLGIGVPFDQLESVYGSRLTLTHPGGEPPNDAAQYAIDGDAGLDAYVEDGDDGPRLITLTAGTACFDNGP